MKKKSPIVILVLSVFLSFNAMAQGKGKPKDDSNLDERVAALEAQIEQILSGGAALSSRISGLESTAVNHEGRISVLEAGGSSGVGNTCSNNYCGKMGSSLLYVFALTSTARDYDFQISDFNIGSLSDVGYTGGCFGEFSIYSGDSPFNYSLSGDNCLLTSEQRTEIASLLQTSGGTLRLSSTDSVDLMITLDPSNYLNGIKLLPDTNVRADSYVFEGQTLRIYRPAPEDGFTDRCIALAYTTGGQNAVLIPGVLLPRRPGGQSLFEPFNGEVRVCTDTTPGQYQTEFVMLDGLGGRKTQTVTVVIEQEQRFDGEVVWEP